MVYIYHIKDEAGKPHTFQVRRSGRRIMDQVQSGELQVVPYGVRLLCYMVMTVGLVQAIVLLVQYQDAEEVFSENGLLEWLQLGILLLSSVFLTLSARELKEIRDGVHILSFMPLIASVRELDQLLDIYVFDGAWQLVVIGLLGYMVYFYWHHRLAVKRQMVRIVVSPPGMMLMAAFITVMVFSRLFGQQVFWQYALQENYLRLVARIAEEGCEVFGYLLLLFGCLELLVYAFSCGTKGHKKAERNMFG